MLLLKLIYGFILYLLFSRSNSNETCVLVVRSF